jgi:hypothetical protein
VELAGDGVRISSKTGSFLDLRHEVGVVEIGSDRIAIAAFTRSAAPAEEQMEADFAIGHAARLLVEVLRHGLQWTVMPREGQFPALEKPDLLSTNISRLLPAHCAT